MTYAKLSVFFTIIVISCIHVCFASVRDIRPPPPQSCCNGTRYYLGDGVCCEESFHSRNDFPDRSSLDCCGKDAYDRNSMVCCNGQLKGNPYQTNGGCCNGETYNGFQQICCGGKLTEIGNEALTCCGDQAYSLKSSICCNGAVIAYPNNTRSAACCNGKIIDTKTHLCCNKKVLRRLNNDYSACCGEKPMDTSREICCQGITLPWRDANLECCGSTTFNPLTHTCCHDTPVAIPTGVADPTEFIGCCGKQVFSYQQSICCEETLYNYSDGVSCCGSKTYNWAVEYCCGKTVLPRGNETVDCCGETRINTDLEMCCPNDKVVLIEEYKTNCNIQCDWSFPFEITRDGIDERRKRMAPNGVRDNRQYTDD